ncbi:MAG: tetratricopeptide repeat protein [Candidatus Methanoperedens sp.]|nr:tetratricopeptide repeat protein [Candidatus Methanoperedens sp.]
MPENNKTEEFLKKLAPCIERGELEACVEEAARVAREMGIGAGEVFDLSVQELDKGNYAFTYVLAFAAARGLEGNEKAIACANAGVAARFLGKLRNSEEHYKRAIEANPKYAEAYYNYAILLSELERIEEAEQQYLKAVEADPKYASAHYNYAILLSEMGRIREAEEHFKKAIDADPQHANAKINYANLLNELNRKDKAEEYYKKAIEADPKYALAHYNYATLLSEMGRMEEAEQQYLKAIESDPKYVGAHHNYAIILSEMGRKDEAKEQYLEVIKANPNYANAHGAYGLLLIELDKRNDAWKETEKASNIFKETGNITQSYLAKAWFYERYSEKNFNRKKFWESGDDAGKAADEYLKAAETADGALKDNFSQQGNILKAKSFVRKVPIKSWRRKILYWFGKNPDIPDIINNLKEAASYYEKAALCPIEERQDICNACHTSITVFSETLTLMEALINKRSPEINKKDLIKKLDGARLIYKEKKMKNGVALVDTLIQLITCVDELAVHKASGLGIQKEKCGKCYNKLTEVSENLDGALNVIAEHSIEAIREYAKKQGMGFIEETKPKQSFFDNWIVKAGVVLGIIASIILLLQFLKLDSSALDLIKSLISRIGIT